MKVVKCENGHFFDLQKDSVCPRCGTEVYASVNAAIAQNSKVDKKAIKEQKKQEKMRAKLDKKRKKEIASQVVTMNPTDIIKTTESTENLKTATSMSTVTNLNEEAHAMLVEKVKQEPINDDAPTEAFYDEQSNADDEKTVYLDDFEDEQQSSIDPVVGWLVCTEGNNVGKSYELKTGVNNIGRAVDMDVSIQGDNTVTRDRHAILTYEPLSKEYLINAGPGRNITYLNGKMVINSSKLENRDCIKLGKTKLVFVPLCTNSFDWN